MTDDPREPRTVLEFRELHGLSRHEFRVAREKAGVRPNDNKSILSVSDQRKLLRHLAVKRRTDRAVNRILVPQPTRAAPPERPVKSEAEIEEQARHALKSLNEHRRVVIALTGGHVVDDGTGNCVRCRIADPCPTKRLLHSLDREIADEIAVAAAGEGPGPASASRWHGQEVGRIYEARDRWLRVLTWQVKDHLRAGDNDRCEVCHVDDPCQTKAALFKLNRGIARRIERLADTMTDEDIRATFRRRDGFDDEDEWWTGS